MKNIKAVTAITVSAALSLMACSRILSPSSMRIHIARAPWSKVIVRSGNLEGEKVFRPGDSLVLSPIEHGVYTVAIEMVKGQTLWTEMMHTDVGVRRQIDLYYDGNTNSDEVVVRETCNNGEVLFEGRGLPKDTSADKPLRLDWI